MNNLERRLMILTIKETCDKIFGTAIVLSLMLLSFLLGSACFVVVTEAVGDYLYKAITAEEHLSPVRPAGGVVE